MGIEHNKVSNLAALGAESDDTGNGPARAYEAIINTPGYLPQADERALFESAASAWAYLRDERKREEDDTEGDEYSETFAMLEAIAEALDAQSEMISSLVNDDGTGVLYGGTPGYDGSHDLGVAYSVVLTDAEIPED